MSAGTLIATPAGRALWAGPAYRGLMAAVGGAVLLLLCHPYLGIVSDGEVYSLQALRHIYPWLGRDLFFRFGSQDSYTVFPAVHAFLIRCYGLESAGWLLARLGMILFLIAALPVARSLMDWNGVWLALALLLIIPGSYGGHGIFSYNEDTVTPRIFSEAFALSSVAAMLYGRWRLSLLAIVVGVVLHPLMAIAVLPVLVLLVVPSRVRLALWVCGLIGILGLAAIAVWFPVGRVRLMDGEWLRILDDLAPLLNARHWWYVDWQRAFVPVATLLIAVRVLPDGKARQLGLQSLAIGLAGFALFLFASFVLPVEIFVQGQTWRWMWLAKAVAALLLVPIGEALWRRGLTGRGLLLLLAVAWLGADSVFGMEGALLALLGCVLVWGSSRPLPALGLAAGVIGLAMGCAILHLSGASHVLLGVAFALVLWWLCRDGQNAMGRIAGVLLVAIALSATVFLRMHQREPLDFERISARMASWQALIGEDQTVLFPEDGSAIWLMLHRQSYIGSIGIVFSRDAALATEARFDAIRRQARSESEYFTTGSSQNAPPSADGLRRVCSLGDLDWVLSAVALPVSRRSVVVGPPLGTLNLYDCHALRVAAVVEKSS